MRSTRYSPSEVKRSSSGFRPGPVENGRSRKAPLPPRRRPDGGRIGPQEVQRDIGRGPRASASRQEEHTSELTSQPFPYTRLVRAGLCVGNVGVRFGFYNGGANDCTKLMDALDEIFAERGQKIFERLQARTGREWSIAQGPPPDATPT